MALQLILAGETHTIEILRRKPTLRLKVDGRLYDIAPGGRTLLIDGAPFAFARAIDSGADKELAFVRHAGRTFEISFVDPRADSAAHDSHRDEIHAPMPGAIVSLAKKAGDLVQRGETIVTIESMKLQTALVAPRDGQVEDILRGEGETFEKDEILVRLAPVVEG